MAGLTSLRKKKRRNKMVSRKISKVARDSPNLTHKQVLGKAFGILRHEGKIK